MDDSLKLDLQSKDITAERIDKLRDLFPEVFKEGKIDFDRLKQALGEDLDPRREQYGLSWAGKAEAIKNIQAPSVGTLVPVPEESVNFDTTENLIIEGDNLEVLKLLQKSYHGKVKMIYIDPPYNTGNEFIYPDNFREGLEDYLRYSGQMNGDGIKLTTNTETDGRFHSKWLNMMYPRLFLARNLLREDGVIFVSIDDHEVKNLRYLMDEIFGEENFVSNLIWEKKFSPQNDDKYITDVHDHILLYAKNKEKWSPYLLPRSEEANSRFSNPDNDPRGPWSSGDLTSKTKAKGHSYPITSPHGKIFYPPTGRQWAPAMETFEKLLKDNRIWFGLKGNNVPRIKQFLSEVQFGIVPMSIWKHNDVGHNQEAKQEFKKIFYNRSIDFDTPKPTRLIKQMLQLTTNEINDVIILDFFAGSGTTAQAVLEMNAHDGGNRKFILIQLPEPIEREDYPTIVDITKERVRRVINRINNEKVQELDFREDKKQDRGFKFFKLTSSNFKIWDAKEASKDADELAKQLTLFADNLKTERSKLDILYEILLKAGLLLSTRVKTLFVSSQEVFSADNGQLLICLEQSIERETLRGMIKLQPQQVICLDAAFHGQDKLKTNTVLEMKSHDIQFRTV